MITRVDSNFLYSNMKTDIIEREGQYLIEIELPGYRKEDIDASLENGYLTITAHRHLEIEPEGQETHYLVRERATGDIRRSFQIGENVKQQDISAALKDGVLKVIIACKEDKVEGERRKMIPIH